MNILVIDDDSAMTDLLKLILQGASSNITAANLASEGIQLAREIKPDVIILDMIMPDMDGWEACKAIRKFSNTPILVMSAVDDPDMIARVLNAGADDYLIKPVTNGILVANLKKLVRRKLATKELPSRFMMDYP